MSEPQSRLKGDRIVESLERGEHWFTQHRIKIALCAGVFIVAAFASQALDNQRRETQESLWNNASKLKTTDEKLGFISANPDAQAAVFLMLQTSRQLLDEGKFSESEALATKFITKYSDHPRLSSALLIRAFAREENGELDGARADYKKVESMEDKVNRLLSSQALARLL